VVFELVHGAKGWSYNILYESASNTPMLLDKAGNLYGAIGAGKYHGGAIAELTPGSPYWTYSTLHSFDLRKGHHDGYDPLGALVLDASGNLYGTTKLGTDGAIVFELTPKPKTSSGEWTEHVLHRFPFYLYAGVIFDRAGNLYGATASGGASNQNCPQGCGTIFELTRSSSGHWKETVLHEFPDFWNGASPLGTLASDRAGNLYGTTAGGGKTQHCLGGCGVVFKMTHAANGKWTYTVLHRFAGPDGANPQAGVTLDKKGNIYGTTVQGGAGGAGVVFEITQ
jgi:hypothetical protein